MISDCLKNYKYHSNPLFIKASQIISILQNHGFPSFIVGGTPRDLLLGSSINDVDIATAARPEEIMRIFPHSYPIGIAFGVVLVVFENQSFEIASFRCEDQYIDGRRPSQLVYTTDPELDSRRRDFTINAFYFDPISGNLFDFHHGLQDLEQGILRTVGPAMNRFNEDYLRMLRAVRFVARLNFSLDKDAAWAIRQLAPNVAQLSAERVRDELNAMLIGHAPNVAIQLLDNLGLLSFWLPELSSLKGVEQPVKYHPEGDVWNHTLLILKKMIHPDLILAWSCLLHDIGKPSTIAYKSDGQPCFYEHERAGAELAKNVLARLKFDKSHVQSVCDIIESHMRFSHVQEMRVSKIRRFLADPLFPSKLELLRLDCLSSFGKVDSWLFLIDQLLFYSNEIRLPSRLITGEDVLAKGFSKGPQIKQILNQIMDLHLEGTIKTREDALAFLDTIKEKC